MEAAGLTKHSWKERTQSSRFEFLLPQLCLYALLQGIACTCSLMRNETVILSGLFSSRRANQCLREWDPNSKKKKKFLFNSLLSITFIFLLLPKKGPKLKFHKAHPNGVPMYWSYRINSLLKLKKSLHKVGFNHHLIFFVRKI